MTGDPFRKVLPGEKITISAAAWNAMLDAARETDQGTLFGSDAPLKFRQTGIVKLQNATGEAQPRFAVLGLNEPIILPTANAEEFKRQVTFKAVKPDKNQHKGKFAVLLQPIGKDKIGIGVVAGVVLVRLAVDPNHHYDCAEIIDGQTNALRNVPAGSARVLWMENTSDPELWAVVRLDDGDFQAHVFILSNVPDEEGFYDGEVQRYDVATKTWQTLFPCKVVDINQ
jgi:hypothetical protein